MSKSNRKNIEVQGTSIAIISRDQQDFISLTDIARRRNSSEPFSIINNWMRGRSTIEFLGLWEKLSNPDFKPIEFERFRTEAGSNYFVLSPQRWIEATQAIGIISKSGRYGGTFAHREIAFEFASWISPKFKLYLIKVPRTLSRPTSVRHRRIRRIGATDTFHRPTPRVANLPVGATSVAIPHQPTPQPPRLPVGATSSKTLSNAERASRFQSNPMHLIPPPKTLTYTGGTRSTPAAPPPFHPSLFTLPKCLPARNPPPRQTQTTTHPSTTPTGSTRTTTCVSSMESHYMTI